MIRKKSALDNVAVVGTGVTVFFAAEADVVATGVRVLVLWCYYCFVMLLVLQCYCCSCLICGTGIRFLLISSSFFSILSHFNRHHESILSV